MRIHSKRVLLAPLPALLAAGVIGVMPSAAASSKAAASVAISGSAGSYHFSPHTVHLKKGGTVHWSWSSDAPHNVTFSKLGKHSATGASESFKLHFAAAGTYQYHCSIHHFTGTVVVK